MAAALAEASDGGHPHSAYSSASQQSQNIGYLLASTSFSAASHHISPSRYLLAAVTRNLVLVASEHFQGLIRRMTASSIKFVVK